MHPFNHGPGERLLRLDDRQPGSNAQKWVLSGLATIHPELGNSTLDRLDERIGLLASTEDNAWERSPDTGRPKSSHPV
jgi:hypothetical protein